MSFSVYYLADKPEYKDACAAWGYGRWGVQKKESSLQKAQQKMEQGAQKDSLPLTIVAVDTETNTSWYGGCGLKMVSSGPNIRLG